MTATEAQFKVATLDDYQKVALQMADWSRLQSCASIEVFSDTLTHLDLRCHLCHAGENSIPSRHHRASASTQAHRIDQA